MTGFVGGAGEATVGEKHRGAEHAAVMTRASSRRRGGSSRGPRRGGRVPAQPAQVGTVWQHPFVDVFKTFAVASAERRGDVVEELDKEICKRVFRIRGAVAANNFLRLPHPRSPAQSLGLTGEYVYLHMRDVGMKYFVVHLDFTVAVVNVLRVTLSNMYSEVKATSRCLQCPCVVMVNWAVVCVHVPSLLAMCPGLPPHSFVLKSVQFCASMVLRNVYTSDIRYTPETLPREMMLDQGSFEGRYSWVDVPGPFGQPFDDASIVGAAPPCDLSGAAATPGQTGANEVLADDLSSAELPCDEAIGAATDLAPELESTWPQPQPPPPVAETAYLGDGSSEALSSPRLPELTALGGGRGLCDTSLPSRSTWTRALPDPLLEVSRLVGVSRANRKIGDIPTPVPRRFAVFVRAAAKPMDFNSTLISGVEEASYRILYASSMTLCLVDPVTHAQRCFFGHSRPIEVLEASDDGCWVASAQCGDSRAPPLVRLWRVEPSAGALVCVYVLSCPSLNQVSCLCFDPSAKYLVLSGADAQNRQKLLIWDVSRVASGGKVTPLARQTSADWDIDCVRFSPFEELQLVTCGRESIRFWRVKDGHLPGQSVVLNALARQNHFTCVAFEHNRTGQPYFLGEHLADHQRMFVGTAKGKVLQLSYRERKVQVVYSLHTEAITSMCANEGFVVTASADGYVRVWPLDFKSFYLHAMHDARAVGVDLTPDGLQVLCCTQAGSVGLLDMQSHGYTDVARSHGTTIVDAALSLNFQELVTASADGMLKVWSLETLGQTYEFSIPDDMPTVVACHPGSRHLFAVGFRSGSLRIFDVDGPAILCEHRHHLRPVLSLAFVSGDECGEAAGPGLEAFGRIQVVTCDAAGALAIHDEAANFEVVRTPQRSLCATPPELCPAMACSPPRLLQYLDAQSVGLCTYPRLEPIRRLRIASGASVTSLALSLSGCAAGRGPPRFAVLGTSDSRILLFSAQNGQLLTSYGFASGPVYGVTLAAAAARRDASGAPGASSSAAAPPALLLAATGDNLMRLARVRLEDEETALLGSSAGLAGASTARVCLEEQCFMGHAVAPHRLMIGPSCIVSVSSGEVISWTSFGNFLEHLILEQLQSLNDEQRGSQQALAPPLGADREPEDVLRPAEAEAAEAARATAEAAALAAAEAAEVEAVAADAAAALAAEEATASAAEADAAATVAAAADPRTDGLDAESAAEFGEVGTEMSPEIEAAGTVLSADSLESPREATSVQEEAGGPPELLSISGCCVSGGFSWSPSLGALCHAIGDSVVVETPGSRAGSGNVGAAAARLPGAAVLAVDFDPGGRPMFAALSASAQEETEGKAFLSLLRLVAGPGGGCELCLEGVAELPCDAYFEQWRRCGAGARSPLLLRTLRCSTGDALSARVVTVAALRDMETCRVDVWDFQGACGGAMRGVLSFSAEVAQRPLDIATLTPHFSSSAREELLEPEDDADEFVMVCSHTVVFWRAPHATTSAERSAIAASPQQLQFQLADPPEAWPAKTAGGFRALCVAHVPLGNASAASRPLPADDDGDGIYEQSSCQRLLFVSTMRGRIWVYDADENGLLGELVLPDAGEAGAAIDAIVCAEWPTVVYASAGGVLRAVDLVMESRRRAPRVASEPLCLRLDGDILQLRAGPGATTGVASTSSNAIWYFDMRDGLRIPLQSFHAGPSCTLTSNAALLQRAAPRGSVGAEEGAADPPEMFASCGTDGICLWSKGVEEGSRFQVCAQYASECACTDVTFLRADLLAGVFTDGLLRFCGLSTLAVVASFQVFAGEPLTCLEAIDTSTLVVGSSGGKLAQLAFDLSEPAGPGSGWKVECSRPARLQGPEPASAACRIVRAGDTLPAGLFLACFAGLELRVWSRPLPTDEASVATSSRLAHAWIWPESEPRSASAALPLPPAACWEMLTEPPLVACFVSAGGGAASLDVSGQDALVVAAAARASCLYVYSCLRGTIVNRVCLASTLPSVMRLIPLASASTHGAGGERASRESGELNVSAGSVIVLCADRFARLQLSSGGCRASWLEEPVFILGGLHGQRRKSLDRAAPDAVIAVCGKERRLVLKGDSSISSWAL
eukprot:TRINITY_DN20709_c1_g3_i1.p1 TRINITY_DN20709_c1_g3~~TRINITY_DN20709_c1_g3_i1.p1  ORF type:complete len:2082 (-),score=410.92 TRINITY_DN20709_c1_g3_i1:81-6326(-)